MCTFPVQPICTFSCTAHFISLHILLLILFHYLFLISFSPYLYIYSLVFCFIVFIAFMLFLFYYYFFCTFHWADLSWLTFHYLLYPVWLCMWQIIKNLEPWTQYPHPPCWCLSQSGALFPLLVQPRAHPSGPSRVTLILSVHKTLIL